MAINLKEGSDENTEMSEINVTPFIDVMLVLLIIFMVAAPLATVDIKVDLPASTAIPQPRPEQPIVLTLKADRQLYLGNELIVNPDLLARELEKQTKGNKETTIFFQADKTVNYEDLINVMNDLRKTGYLKIGLVGLEAMGNNE
ncbi:TonB system transport protein ExbD [Entomomonas asaccharolytica]|uniref:Biopolymer transport protein ExbD n=1 Tax=Entomomonas asaccharolytica TaxID=2785331 RepID=A0A974RXJ9_9GAMM|nr:TonB system transport protein ExbD [Entomomonas asaccharolytica]QQP86346.1 TonB system transport protein ExbD [Entomomonas asaccharolytica]